MAKLGIFASVAAIVAALTFASVRSDADDKTPCVRKDFKTQIAKDACAKGGQKAAQDAMKAFMKNAKIDGKKIESCKFCHKTLEPDYVNKDDAVANFKKAGGKLL